METNFPISGYANNFPMYPETQRRPVQTNLTGSENTELVGLVFELAPRASDWLYAQYAIGLHAWFLDQVRQADPELSAYLHDGQSEKPFTISGLEGSVLAAGRDFQLREGETYRWYVTALSVPVVKFLREWVKQLPEVLTLRNAPLWIRSVAIAFSNNLYSESIRAAIAPERSLKPGPPF